MDSIYIPNISQQTEGFLKLFSGFCTRIFETQHPTNYPAIYKNHFSSLLIPNSKIQSRTKDIAKLIQQNYNPTEPIVLVCILKGSSPYFNMLCNELSLLSVPYRIEFIRVKSYVGRSSSGDVKMFHVDMPKSITNHHVLIVEDIVDTGMTLSAIMPKFQECHPKSIEVCTLLEKRLGESNDNDNNNDGDDGQQQQTVANKIVPKYVGFSIPDEFVIGFGLDYNEMYRDLRDIWVISQEGIDAGGYADC